MNARRETSYPFSAITCMLIVVIVMCGCDIRSVWTSTDESLLQALRGGNENRFERLLERGANPNAVLGPRSDDWVMCLVTQRGNESFLRLAFEFGADVNLRNDVEGALGIYSAPLLCAIQMHNDNAIDFLIKQGADLDMRVRPDAGPYPESQHVKQELWGKTFYGSPLTKSLGTNNYRLVYQIMTTKKLNEEELWVLKFRLENGPINTLSTANDWRMKVVDLLRERGYEVDPWMPKSSDQ